MAKSAYLTRLHYPNNVPNFVQLQCAKEPLTFPAVILKHPGDSKLSMLQIEKTALIINRRRASFPPTVIDGVLDNKPSRVPQAWIKPTLPHRVLLIPNGTVGAPSKEATETVLAVLPYVLENVQTELLQFLASGPLRL